MRGDHVFGRDAELAALRAWLAARDRLPSGFVLGGHAGIGKTSLWHVAVELAASLGYLVLQARPAGAEVTFAYSALADLFRPVAPTVLRRLPAPQRRALEVALLLAEPPPSGIDARAVGTATAGALAAAATEQPVLVAIDDAQWLDAASAEVLTFALRRLAAPVAVLTAVRTGPAAPELLDTGALGVRRIDLQGLSLGALQRLLRVRLDLHPPRPVLRRLHELSAGNPFVALELARGVEDAGDGLHEALAARIASLPAETRAALLELAAAAHPQPSWDGTLGPAFDAGLLEIGDGALDYAHPLLRAAVYTAASPEERRAAHAALASRAESREERARHLALAAAGADAAAARALAEAGADALRRGATLEAIDLYERALELTPADDPAAYLEHALGLAEANRRAGDAARGVAVVERALPRAPDARARARLLTWLADASGSRAHVEQALEAAGDDGAARAAALNVKAELLHAADEIPAALATAGEAVAAARDSADAATLARALGAYGQLAAMTGDPAALDALHEATRLEPPDDPAALYYGPTMTLGLVSLWRDELDEAVRIFDAQLAAVASVGDEGARGSILQRLVRAEVWRGNLRRARALSDEMIELRETTGWDEPINALWVRALVHLHLGDLADARAEAEAALALAVDGGDPDHFHVRHVLGAIELQEGNAAGALMHLERLPDVVAATGRTEPGICPFHAEELEALVRAGSPRAAARIEEVAALGVELARPRLVVAARRARGLLLGAAGRRDEAVAELQAAVAASRDLPVPSERARTLAALGAELNRARRRGEARTALAEAAVVFERIGALHLARRTRDELNGAPLEGLTPAERRVAAHAAAGRSTKEIAAELFVSPKTVENHLSRIYDKLGVRSRVELARLYGGSEGESPISGSVAAP